MGDIDDLLTAFDTGSLVRPSAEIPNIVDLTNAIARLVGVDGLHLTSNSNYIAELIGPSDHLVFVVVDGLGMSAVDKMTDDAFISGYVTAELRTVFPSSTPVAFTTLATGAWPNEHGVPSWDVYLSEVDCVATIIKFIRRWDEKQLTEMGMTAEQAFPLPSLVSRVTRDTLSLKPKEIASGIFSRYWAGGTPALGYKTLREAVDAIIRRVREAKYPTFTFLYVPHVDSAAHEYGFEHNRVVAVIREVDREMRRLVERLAGKARLVITADHGLLDASKDQTYEIKPSDELISFLNREPWGDKRCANFDVRDDRTAEFKELFRKRFGEGFFLLSVEEVARFGLFGPGPISPVTQRRIGNFMAISRGAEVIKYLFPTVKKDSRIAVSHHSGLSHEEMLVPLAVA